MKKKNKDIKTEVKKEEVKVTEERAALELEPLFSPLLTQKYTQIFFESNHPSNVPHNFFVVKADDSLQDNEIGTLGMIAFQDGPIKESGVNGVMGEDLIAMVIKRLECFQAGPYACRENALALTKLEEALMWLRKRTTEREMRQVEGTHKV